MIDVLFIVPPFVTCSLPFPTVCTLQSILLSKNISSKIFYANILLKSRIDYKFYEELSEFFKFPDTAEFIFSSYAFPQEKKKHKDYESKLKQNPYLYEKVYSVKKVLEEYLNDLTSYIKQKSPKIVWIDTFQNQLTASITIINLIKKILPDTIVAMGGLKCLYPMGEEILKLTPNLDFVFSGEPDIDFPDFCQKKLNNKSPTNICQGILHCVPVQNLDELPFPDFNDYFLQIRSISSMKKISFEGSRGCWWGQNKHCIFCGHNGKDNSFKKKSPERAILELNYLIKTYNPDIIQAFDSIIPMEYPEKVFSKLNVPSNIKYIFYELSPKLKYKQLKIIKKRSFNICQSGIETFDDKLLKILNKGTTAINNIRFLKDSRSLGIDIRWNLLYDIPGESEHNYEDMIKLFPLIAHLQPPNDIRPIFITRFTPLFNKSHTFEINSLKPLGGYQFIFPDNININRLARYFSGEYKKALNNKILKNNFFKALDKWKKKWSNKKKKPNLELLCRNDEKFIIDSRSNKKEIIKISNNSYNLLRKLVTPILEKKLQEYILKNGHIETFQHLINHNFILKINNYYLSLVILNKV